MPGIEQIAFDDTTWSLTGALTIEGTSSNDWLFGTQYGDTLYGLGSADVIYGNRGNDTLIGGAGNDDLRGGAGDDTYVFAAGSGSDQINADTNGTDTIRLNGYATTDVRLWTTQYGELYVGSKATPTDQVYIYVGTTGASGTTGELALSSIEQIVFDDTTIWNLTGGLSLEGTSSNDWLFGTQYGDTLYGLDSADVLYGNRGNDTLIGGGGNDDLRGGAGDDTYVFAAGSGSDQVNADTNGTDTIRLNGYATTDVRLWSDSYGQLWFSSKAAPTDNVFVYVGTTGASGTTSELALPGIEQVVFDDTTTWSLTGALNIEGTSSGDYLYGTQYADTLTGLDGGDQLYGNRGNDTLIGGAGNDTINGGADIDTASYSLDPAAVIVNLTTGSATDGYGNTDTLSAIEKVIGSAYNDTITGSTGNDDLDGATGNDTISGAAGDDILAGGTGTDTLTYASAGAAVTVNLATTTSQNTGGAGSDTVNGFENLIGSAFNDTLTGDGNANVIEGLAGNDTINGAGGTDTLTYASTAAGVTVNLATTTGQNTVGAGTDTITNFENLIGSAFNDTLTGNASANVIEGLAGDDTLNGAGGTDTLTYASAGAGITINLATTTAQNTGGAGTDTISSFENLTGSAFNDTLTGTSGNNVIEGGAGNDTINGQGGTDTLTYANASGAITLSLAITSAQNTNGAGTDTVSNFENLTGSAFNDTLTGSTAANTINGGDGNDTIQGGAGNDTLTGGNGTDTASYTSAGSAVTVNLATATGQNTVGAGTDTLSGFENLTGSGFNDTLTGTSSANTIIGGAGNDTINGGDGADLLYGGSGQDTLTGSTGGDVFLFENASAFSNVDTIADFNAGAGDKIDVHDVIDLEFDPLTEAISDFVNFTNSGANSIMSIDRDGAGTTYAFTDVATLTGVTNQDEVALYNSGNLLAA